MMDGASSNIKVVTSGGFVGQKSKLHSCSFPKSTRLTTWSSHKSGKSAFHYCFHAFQVCTVLSFHCDALEMETDSKPNGFFHAVTWKRVSHDTDPLFPYLPQGLNLRLTGYVNNHNHDALNICRLKRRYTMWLFTMWFWRSIKVAMLVLVVSRNSATNLQCLQCAHCSNRAVGVGGSFPIWHTGGPWSSLIRA